jgi:2,5-dihydroxypyridine 5,6-dioxygenase
MSEKLAPDYPTRRYYYKGGIVSFATIAAELLKCSKLSAGEKVLILSCPEYSTTRPGVIPVPAPGYVQTLRMAAESLGAHCTVAEVSESVYLGRTAQETHTPGLGELMKKMDLLLNFPNFTAPTPVTAALNAGARQITIHQDAEVHRRMLPTQERKERVLVCAELLAAAEKIRITSKYGTDLTCSKKGRPTHAEYGMADEKGRWDNAAGGQVACAPVETSLNGKLVLEPGSGICHLCYVTDMVECTLEEGRLVDIRGGASAKILAQWLAQFNDPDSSLISHVGWGCDERADWTKGYTIDSAMDWENYYGNLLIGFGINLFSAPAQYCGFAGQNAASSHLDIAVRSVDFYLDDELVVSDNRYVHPKLKKVVARNEPFNC